MILKNIIYNHLDKLYPINNNFIFIKNDDDLINAVYNIFGTSDINFFDWAEDRCGNIYTLKYPSGTIMTIKNKQKHSFNDKPAVIYHDGVKIWYKNGDIHRDNDKPAWILGKLKSWYKNGLRHRDNNKPAVIYPDGKKEWYQNGWRMVY